MSPELLSLLYFGLSAVAGYAIRHFLPPSSPAPAPVVPIPNVPVIPGDHPILSNLAAAIQDAINKALLDFAAKISAPKP